MSDDLIKKQRPSDESDSDDKDNSNNLQNENDEFGMEEYGYDLDSKKEEDTDKRKKSDDDDDDNNTKSSEEDEEYRKRLDDLEALRKMREEKKEKDLKIVKDRKEKREEEKKKKEKQWEEDSDREKKEQKEKLIAGEKVEKKRVFTHKKEEGVFRHKKLANFNTKGLKKIDKRFKKVHGISSEKKRKFLKLLEAYNPSKSLMTKKSFDDFSRRFKSKRFKGPNFERMKKEGIDLRGVRKKFGKRDLDKLRRGVTGEKDPHKYQRKSSNQNGSSPKSSSSGITARMR